MYVIRSCLYHISFECFVINMRSDADTYKIFNLSYVVEHAVQIIDHGEMNLSLG
jgi:hypothetical protein